MANKIKTTVYDNHGNTYKSDVYVQNDTFVNSEIMASLHLPVTLMFYKDQQAKNDGFIPFIAVDNLTDKRGITVFVKQLTQQEALDFNSAALQRYATEYLKGIYGDANVEEV